MESFPIPFRFEAKLGSEKKELVRPAWSKGQRLRNSVLPNRRRALDLNSRQNSLHFRIVVQVIEQAVPRDTDNVILVLIVSDFQVLQGVPLISLERAGPGQCEGRQFSLIVEFLLFIAQVLEHGVRSASRISLLGGRGHNQRRAVMAQYRALS